MLINLREREHTTAYLSNEGNDTVVGEDYSTR